MLKVGRKAPSFQLLDQENETKILKDYRGNWLLLYFYPKDDTPGCTKEACMITDVYNDFKRNKIAVIGVSKDSVKSHKKFAEKYSLPFTLLSDPTMEMMAKYHAVLEKLRGGKVSRSALRVSYVIDPEGVIKGVYPEVDPANHALQVLADVKRHKREEKKKLAAEK